MNAQYDATYLLAALRFICDNWSVSATSKQGFLMFHTVYLLTTI